MQNQLSCEQVCALLSFYAEERLSKKLSECVKTHLESCSYCMEKYNQLKKMLGKFVETPTDENSFLSKQYENFKSNLSAYIDNELDNLDSIKIKKIAISNPLARQDLENIYTFKRLLHSSFERTKNDLKNDFTKSVLLQIQNEQKKEIDPFFKLAVTFFTILICITSGIIYFLYF